MADLIDYYRTYSDETLDEHRRAILTEQERRANLANIPAAMAQLAAQYRDGGGDTADLTAAITEA